MIRNAFSAASLMLGLSLAGAAEALDLSCDDIGAAIGAPIGGMTPDPSSVPAWVENPDHSQLLCAWVTRGALNAMNGAAVSDADLKDAGQILAQLMVYKDPADLQALRSHSPAHKVPLETASPDMWLFDMATEIDFDAPPGLLPPQLIKGDIGVSISTTNLLMTMPVSFEALTTGWSIARSAAVIALIETKR